MDDKLLDYYERELTFVREMGAEFAAKYPKIAGRLLLERGSHGHRRDHHQHNGKHTLRPQAAPDPDRVPRPPRHGVPPSLDCSSQRWKNRRWTRTRKRTSSS